MRRISGRTTIEKSCAVVRAMTILSGSPLTLARAADARTVEKSSSPATKVCRETLGRITISSASKPCLRKKPKRCAAGNARFGTPRLGMPMRMVS